VMKPKDKIKACNNDFSHMAIGGRTCYKIMDIVLDIIANEIINWTDVIIGVHCSRCKHVVSHIVGE